MALFLCEAQSSLAVTVAVNTLYEQFEGLKTMLPVALLLLRDFVFLSSSERSKSAHGNDTVVLLVAQRRVD